MEWRNFLTFITIYKEKINDFSKIHKDERI